MAIKYNDLYLDIRQALIHIGEKNVSNLAREIVSLAAQRTKEEIIADSNLYVNDDIEAKARKYLQRRLDGEPLAYLIGEWEFYGLPLEISSGVLVPRIDTEVVADVAIELAAKFGPSPRILDLCAGSGCIGLAIAANIMGARVTLADISEEALEICRKNVKRNNLSSRVHVVEADAKNDAPAFMGHFDMIVSNPPYIPGGDLKNLDKSVYAYEPRLALDGGKDGLDFYKAIAKKWKRTLKNDGLLIFEVGVEQSRPVAEILRKNGFMLLETRKDTLDIDRVLVARPEFD